MFRKVLLLFVVLVLLWSLPTKADEGLSFWMLGDYNVTGFRLGYVWPTNPDVDENETSSFEIGGLSYWRLWETKDVPQTYGIYGLYHFPGEFDISQIPILAPLAELLPSVANYVGFQGAVEFNGDEEERGFLGPVAGVVLQKFIFDKVDDQIETGIEAQWVWYTDQLEEDIGAYEFCITFSTIIRF